MVQYGDEERKTSVKKGTYHPEWEEHFVFYVEDINKTAPCLQLTVYDWDMTGNHDEVSQTRVVLDVLLAPIRSMRLMALSRRSARWWFPSKSCLGFKEQGSNGKGRARMRCVLNLITDMRRSRDEFVELCMQMIPALQPPDSTSGLVPRSGMRQAKNQSTAQRGIAAY